MLPTRVIRLIWVGITLSGFTPTSSMADNWKVARTPHFEVISAANKGETREIIAESELFYQTLIALMGDRRQIDRPTRIVLFKRERHLEPFKPERSVAQSADELLDVYRQRYVATLGAVNEPDDMLTGQAVLLSRSSRLMPAAWLDAVRRELKTNTPIMRNARPNLPDMQHIFAFNHLDRAVIVLSGESRWDETKQRLYRRYMIQILEDMGVTGPLWVKEGMAAMFGAFQIGRDTYNLGIPDFDLMSFLRDVGYLIPWEDFFAIDPTSTAYQTPGVRQLYNGQALLLVHYCYFSAQRSEAWRPALLALVKDVKRGEQDMSELLERHLGVTLAELMDYLHQKRFPALEQKRPKTWPGKAVEFQAATEEQVKDALLDVQVRLSRDDSTLDELRGIALSSDAESRTFELLGVDALQRDDTSAAEEFFAKANSSGSEHAAVVRYRAEQRLREKLADVNPANLIADEHAIPWRTDLEAALKLDPSDQRTVQWLAWLEALAVNPVMENINHVQMVAQQGLVDPDLTLLAIAVLRARLGDIATAHSITDRYRDWHSWQWYGVVQRLRTAFGQEV